MSLSKEVESSQQMGYQKFQDREALQYEQPKHSQPYYAKHNLLSYRVGFWAVPLLYLLTAAFSLFRWPEDSSSNLASYSIIDIPFDDKVIFMPDAAFEVSPDSMSEDDPWSKLEPTGQGFIEIPVEVGLAEGGSVIKKQYCCISMFYQLHCIASLKAAVGNITNNSLDSKEQLGHLNHCFDYLRQAVMCAGDMTLELAVEYKDIGGKGVAGWGVEHQCRNFQAMKDFAEKHIYLNSTGIL